VLTEDPEHQRARHRLIGAAVLVLVAIVVLPRVLDSKPKMVSNDIAVTIVSSLPAVSPITPALPPVAQSKAEDPKVVPPSTAVTPVPTPTSEAKEISKAPIPASSAPSAAKANTAGAADKTLGLAAGEEIVVAAKPNVASNSSTNPVPAGKFVIQIGAFASEERANGWIAKLKEQKIPNYVLNRTGADGTKLFALRAGPFSDKESADAAEKKIKAMGLTPRIVEVGKQ
jgi:DedD protein